MYDNVFLMKVGPHAGMKLDDIINEKTEFENKHDYFLWGHGQNAFGRAINPHINNNTFLLLHEGDDYNDTEGGVLNVCECDRGRFRLPEGAIWGSGKSGQALVCRQLESVSETIYLSEYYIPNGCGIFTKSNYEYYEALNYLQSNTRFSGVFGKHKGLFSNSEIEKFKNNLKLKMCKQGENSNNYLEKLGRVDLRAQIIEAVECFLEDENKANKLPLYQPPKIK